MIKAFFTKYTLKFNHPAGTSRGVMHTRDTWFIFIDDGHNRGIGEIAPLQNLSCDHIPGLETKIEEVCRDIENYRYWIEEGLENFPSVRFGLETAILDLKSGAGKILFPSPFTAGKAGIATNGLIWMGDPGFMQKQIREKISQGFDCIKLKIGSLDFDTEISIIKAIRQDFGAENPEIRLDANGAFSAEDAPEKLSQFAKLNIHSIEQPIKQGQLAEMAALCNEAIIPIALDEELIGINNRTDKIKLLISILPDYIILKPSLHGGISGCTEWIRIAESLNIGWWITSALESNIGLNAIAQWTATLGNPMPHGLGTGQLFANNIASPLSIKNSYLFYDPGKSWDLSCLDNEF